MRTLVSGMQLRVSVMLLFLIAIACSKQHFAAAPGKEAQSQEAHQEPAQGSDGNLPSDGVVSENGAKSIGPTPTATPTVTAALTPTPVPRPSTSCGKPFPEPTTQGATSVLIKYGRDLGSICLNGSLSVNPSAKYIRTNSSQVNFVISAKDVGVGEFLAVSIMKTDSIPSTALSEFVHVSSSNSGAFNVPQGSQLDVCIGGDLFWNFTDSPAVFDIIINGC